MEALKELQPTHIIDSESEFSEDAYEEFCLQSEDGKAVSEAEYWEFYYEHPDFSYEWNNGYLEEKPVSDYAGYLMYQWFSEILNQFLRTYPIAKMIGIDFGFRLPLSQKITIRKPDLAVVKNDNPASLNLTDRSYKGIFDLCIEQLSDTSKKAVQRDTIFKKAEYAGVGVAEYYILDGKGKETAFYQYTKQGIYKPIKPDRWGIIHSGALPGFQFRLMDLYNVPPMEKLVQDKVYQDFVLPFHQREKQRADEAEKWVELEKQRAELEKQRADEAEKWVELEKQRAEQAEKKLKALEHKLKALGISID